MRGPAISLSSKHNLQQTSVTRCHDAIFFSWQNLHVQHSPVQWLDLCTRRVTALVGVFFPSFSLSLGVTFLGGFPTHLPPPPKVWGTTFGGQFWGPNNCAKMRGKNPASGSLPTRPDPRSARTHPPPAPTADQLQKCNPPQRVSPFWRPVAQHRNLRHPYPQRTSASMNNCCSLSRCGCPPALLPSVS